MAKENQRPEAKIEPMAQRLNEEQLKQMADKREGTRAGALPEAGKQLPRGFDNPEPGDSRHRCVDPHGAYQPSWYCLLLHDGEGMPQRQSFNCAGRKYSVRVGEWVDVPPEIIEVLRSAEVSTVRYDQADDADLATGVPRPMSVARRPRFNYSVLPSA